MKTMKRFYKILICATAALLFSSCVEEVINEPIAVNDEILVSFSSSTKATTASTSVEAYVNHVDIIFFTYDSSDEKGADYVHSERLDLMGSTQATLQTKRSMFAPGQKYYVQVIANSSYDASYFVGKSYSELTNETQEDKNIHLTGLDLGGVAPKYFLMDGNAVLKSDPSSAGVVINNGVASDNTSLVATLARAAAKIEIIVKAGSTDEFEINFTDALAHSDGASYYIRNLPYETFLVDHEPSSETKRITTAKTRTAYMDWNPEQDSKTMDLIAYAYPHEWHHQSVLQYEPCVVVNLPFIYTDKVAGTTHEHPNSWYKIPMSADYKFDRNMYYRIEITINRAGATTMLDPLVVDDIKYDVIPWTDVTIQVGDNENSINFLQLNQDHVDIYNQNSDLTTLSFSSSSYIDKIELLEAYYYNYLDTRVDLSVASNDKYDVYDKIYASAEAGLNGGIDIFSPFVKMSQNEINELILALGQKPVVPEYPTAPVNPQVDEVSEPDPLAIAEKYSTSGFLGRVTVTWDESTKKFSDDSWYSDASERAQREYDAAMKAYNDWLAWVALSAAEKEQAIADYEGKLTKYTADLAEYNAASERLADYNKKVEAIYEASGDSHSNAIRYLKFRVMNQTGQEAIFTVAQYPTIYITNEHGKYSYRSDFGGTNFADGAGNPNYAGAEWNAAEQNWYYWRVASSDAFFGSKVAYSSGNSYTINYCYYTDEESPELATSRIDGLNNPRMYHVHVTATSSSYVIGIPRLDADGFTESSSENTMLVSPSFMIASQLGATLIPSGGIAQAKRHCEQYIEVTEDGVEYDDWRLPTAAEIDIIIEHQDISDAMAVVLTGNAYYCAYNTDGNGRVIYTKSTGKSGGQTAVRCIRDAY